MVRFRGVPHLGRRNPLTTLELDLLHNPIVEVFDDILQEFFCNTGRVRDLAKSKIDYPKTDVMETHEGNLVFRMAVPGLTSNDLDVEIEDNVLTVKGAKNEEAADEGEFRKIWRKELKHSSFVRGWTLPEEILAISDDNPVQTSLKNGILEVIIPLIDQQEKQDKKITIEVKEE